MMQEREHPLPASHYTTPGQRSYSDLPPTGAGGYSGYAQPPPLQGSSYTQSASQLGTNGGYRDDTGAPTPNCVAQQLGVAFCPTARPLRLVLVRGMADPTNPFLNGAKANSFFPALNESWTWGTDRIYGVNLGGWFVLEPCVRRVRRPSLRAARRIDAFTCSWTNRVYMFLDEPFLYSFPSLPLPPPPSPLLHTHTNPPAQSSPPPSSKPTPRPSANGRSRPAMRADGTLEATMEKHCDTFIIEQDIAQIARAGLNWVRVPIPF
ncbi:hypothetical protein DFH06DRAFT_1341745 [Mycena polygramma]|nr:hypothetical protein DFH06DRAFT_1341745 [Mycena polygramma]